MAWTITARDDTTSGTTDQATITTGSFTATADSLVVYGGAGQLNTFNSTATSAVPTTGDSKTFTEIVLLDGADSPLYGDPSSNAYPTNTVLAYFQEDASPVSRTVVWDAGVTPNVNAWYSAGAFDITGHDTTTPIVGTPRSAIDEQNGGDDNVSISVDHVDSLVTGNLVVVLLAGLSVPLLRVKHTHTELNIVFNIAILFTLSLVVLLLFGIVPRGDALQA